MAYLVLKKVSLADPHPGQKLDLGFVRTLGELRYLDLGVELTVLLKLKIELA